MKVRYDKPRSGSVLEDAIGNDLASFTDVAAANNSTIPRVWIEAVQSDTSPFITEP